MERIDIVFECHICGDKFKSLTPKVVQLKTGSNERYFECQGEECEPKQRVSPNG